jgi:hypothetical protein
LGAQPNATSFAPGTGKRSASTERGGGVREWIAVSVGSQSLTEPWSESGGQLGVAVDVQVLVEVGRKETTTDPHHQRKISTMDKIKWKTLTKEIICDLRAVLKGVGIDGLTQEDTAHKEDLVAELEATSVTPAVVLDIKYNKPAVQRSVMGYSKSKLQPQGREEKLEEFLGGFKVWAGMCELSEKKKLEKL